MAQLCCLGICKILLWYDTIGQMDIIISDVIYRGWSVIFQFALHCAWIQTIFTAVFAKSVDWNRLIIDAHDISGSILHTWGTRCYHLIIRGRHCISNDRQRDCLVKNQASNKENIKLCTTCSSWGAHRSPEDFLTKWKWCGKCFLTMMSSCIPFPP